MKAEITVLDLVISLDDYIRIDFGKGPVFGKVESFYTFPVKHGGPEGIKFTEIFDSSSINSIPVAHIKNIQRFGSVDHLKKHPDFIKQQHEQRGY